MNTLFDKASDIIRAASANQLSLYVFCILVTAVLAVLLFHRATVPVRIFAFLITLVLMAVSMVLATPPIQWSPRGANWKSNTENLNAPINVTTVESGNLDYEGINRK